MLKANCVREEEKAAELELRSRLFNFGQFNSDAQVITAYGNFISAHDNNLHSLYTQHCNGEMKANHKSQVDDREKKPSWN